MTESGKVTPYILRGSLSESQKLPASGTGPAIEIEITRHINKEAMKLM